MTNYKVKVNRSGYTFIIITVLLGVSAINTGNNLLYIIVSSLLSFMLLSGLASLYNLRGIKITLVPPKDVFAQNTEYFKAILENTHKFPKFLLSIESNNGRTVVPILLKSKVINLPMVFEKRGLITKVSVTIKTDFPVGLFTRYYTQEIKTSFIVFPKPIPTDIKLFLDIHKGKNPSTNHITNLRGFDEVVGAKEYSGEAMKLIHWKASAKVGKLMAKEMYTASQSPVVLSLDQVNGDLEIKISQLTYIAIKLIEKGYPVGLKLRNEYIKPATGEIQKYKILKALALFH